MDKKHGKNPKDGNKQNNKQAHAPQAHGHPSKKVTRLGDASSTSTSLAWAIAIAGMSSAPRSFWLPKLQPALQDITSYAASNNLTVNTLKNFDPTNGVPSAALYKDLQTIAASLTGDDSAWKTAFSTYASLIPIWMILGKSDSVSYTLQSMSQQLSFLSQSDQSAANAYTQVVKANLTGTPNKAALQAAVTAIQGQFGPPLDILSSSDAQKAA